MIHIQSILLLLGTLALMTTLGTGPTGSLLPQGLRRYFLFVAPSVGYATFCLFSIWLSAATGIATVETNIWATGILLIWALATLIWRRRELASWLKPWRLLLIFVTVAAVVIFFPVIHLGVGGYLGTVNPDFYQSLTFHEFLIRHHASFWVDAHQLQLTGPFQQMFPDAFQARFGAVAFSVFLEQVFGIEARAALITALMGFVTCLPLAVYFFAKSVLGFEERVALVAGLLVTIAAPTTMSFLHTFIGQNSALAMFPLGITLVYLALRDRSLPIATLALLVLNGLFYLYVMALPYILVPFILVILFRLFRSGWSSFSPIFPVIFLAIAVTLVIQLTIFPVTNQFIVDLLDLLGKMTQSQYYADFLTEEIFQYATGITSYPLSKSLYFHKFYNSLTFVLIAFGGFIAFLYFAILRRWARTASKDAVAIVLAMLLTYIAIWVKYTFGMRYGYASFKMVAWLQFLLVPFLAWGIFDLLKLVRGHKAWYLSAPYGGALLVLSAIYPLLNLASALDYNLKSYGRDLYHGSLINSYGISGNPDHDGLKHALAEMVPTGTTVALGFTDSIENFWVAYYLDRLGLKASILSHEEIPFEDAHLPDIENRLYIDSMGVTQKDSQKYFNITDADYYVLPASTNLNKDIVVTDVLGKPIWENRSFRLFKKKNLRDIFVTGRGFYRIEHLDSAQTSWWWPSSFRWSAEGGELYHLNPVEPLKPYRIELSVIAGTGQLTSERTIEFWHNGHLFDEIRIHGAARIVTKPYLPILGVNRIVMKIKEKSVLVPRKFGLWNRDLPRRATPINALFADIAVLPADTPPLRTFPVGDWVEAKQQFPYYSTFDGFDVDGWVRDRAEFTVANVAGAKQMQMRLLIPGNLSFKFPYKVNFVVNGKSHEQQFDKSGEFEITIPLVDTGKSEKLSVEIVPDAAQKIANGMDQREVLQSVRLSAVKFN
jgi:hypothetical protein